MPDPNWRTSSYTSSDSCVEVADNQAGVVWVRDTKDRAGAELALRPVSWGPFLAHISLMQVEPRSTAP
jgi:hypothetical protein